MLVDEEEDLDEVVNTENAEVEQDTDLEPELDQETEENEIVVSIEGEAEEDLETQKGPAPAWVKDVRKTNRALSKELRELKAKLAAGQVASEVSDIGKEPELSDKEIEFDTDKFKVKHREWLEKRLRSEAKQREAEAAEKKQADAWSATLAGHEKRKVSLKAEDYDEAETIVLDSLSQSQQALLIKATGDKSAAMVYAIGKRPKLAAELAKIEDPVDFVVKIVELKGKVTVAKKPAGPPPPERSVRTSSPSGGIDATADRILAECAKTGDMTKYRNYMASKKKPR